MRKMYIFSLLLISQFLNGQATYYPDNLAVSDALRNTFWIKTDTGMATAFIVLEKGHELLITAKHVFKKVNSKKKEVHLEINLQKKWQGFDATIYLAPDSNIDIAILKLKSNIAAIAPLERTNAISVGQSCIFLGFPYGIFYSPTNEEYIPFVKKGFVSSLNGNITFLDGMNNPGFSGGPVIVWDNNSKKPAIYGVISGYYPQRNKSDIVLSNKKNEFNYIENSGIIFCYGIYNVEKIIAQIQ